MLTLAHPPYRLTTPDAIALSMNKAHLAAFLWAYSFDENIHARTCFVDRTGGEILMHHALSIYNDRHIVEFQSIIINKKKGIYTIAPKCIGGSIRDEIFKQKTYEGFAILSSSQQNMDKPLFSDPFHQVRKDGRIPSNFEFNGGLLKSSIGFLSGCRMWVTPLNREQLYNYRFLKKLGANIHLRPHGHYT